MTVYTLGFYAFSGFLLSFLFFNGKISEREGLRTFDFRVFLLNQQRENMAVDMFAQLQLVHQLPERNWL